MSCYAYRLRTIQHIHTTRQGIPFCPFNIHLQKRNRADAFSAGQFVKGDTFDGATVFAWLSTANKV
jgi:hypothetical protein